MKELRDSYLGIVQDLKRIIEFENAEFKEKIQEYHNQILQLQEHNKRLSSRNHSIKSELLSLREKVAELETHREVEEDGGKTIRDWEE